jgi:hypothetical protein
MANFIIWTSIATSNVGSFQDHTFQNETISYQALDWSKENEVSQNTFPRWYRALGPYQLASWLRNHGYTVKIIDFCRYMTIDQIVKITEKNIDSGTIAIGVGTTFWDYNTSVIPNWVNESRAQIENKFTDIKWCLGGANTNQFKNSSSWTTFDGEAENDVLKWLDEISNKKNYRKLFDIKDSSNMFMPDDYIQSYELLPVELGRGCMFKCKFCQYPNIGKKPGTYIKNYHNVYQEILDHHNKWGTTRFYYTDDTVNESVEKVEALAMIAQSVPFKLEWIGYVRPDLIWSKPITSQLLEESGLRSAYFGIESFEKKSSQLIGKGWSGIHGKEWLLNQKQKWNNKITWVSSMIVGIPGQTREQLETDLKWFIENEMHQWVFYGLSIDISNQSNYRSASEFERNYKQYGFEIGTENSILFWKNQGWNSLNSQNFANELNIKSTLFQKPAGWALGELVSLGFDFEDFMYTKIIDLNFRRNHLLAWNFIENYVTKNLL